MMRLSDEQFDGNGDPYVVDVNMDGWMYIDVTGRVDVSKATLVKERDRRVQLDALDIAALHYGMPHRERGSNAAHAHA